MRVHQMTMGLMYGDAITHQIQAIDQRLRAWGLETHIFRLHHDAWAQDLGQPDSEYAHYLNNSDDLLIYHYSINSPNLELFERSRNRKLVIYHNITPPEFFQGYDAVMEADCRRGREALSRLAGCDFAVGDSDYNRRELIAAGVPAAQTDVLPILVDTDKFGATKLDQALYERIRGNGKVNLLFVARLIPSKAFEDLIKLVAAYREGIGENVHLWLIGRATTPLYQDRLVALVERLGLDRFVTFTDLVSLTDLCTYYAAADVYVSASRHEGFAVPLLESMKFGLPILAYNGTAHPDTLGGAGVLFNYLDYPILAETVHALATDQPLRQSIIARQRERLAEFSTKCFEARLRQILTRVGVELPS